MTSPAIRLARECGAADFTNCGGESQVTYLLHTKQLETFYALAQAQALRDAADKMKSFEALGMQFPNWLRDMADDLERKA